MIPLVSIPAIISYYAPHFSRIFSESEYAHFQKYLSGLLVSENKTVSGINRLFVLDTQNQSTLNRFLCASKYDESALNRQRLSLMNQQSATAFKEKAPYGGVLAIDDTMLVHWGRCFDQIHKLYDHANDHYVWAHNLVNLHYSDDQTDYPVYFELWQPADLEELETSLRQSGVKIKPVKTELKITAPEKWRKHLFYKYSKHQREPLVRAAYRSKVIMAEELLSQFFNEYDLDIAISFDRWFTHPAFCKFIDKELGKAYVGGIKSNTQLLLAGSKKISIGDFVQQLKVEHLAAFEEPNANAKTHAIFQKTTIRYKGKKEVYYNYCKTHHICGYGRQRLLISFQKSDLSGTARTFICNRLKWRGHQICRVGRHRWPVEEYHKEGKAEGLDQYQVRNKPAIQKHIALVAVVYSLLRHAQHDLELLNLLQQQLNINIEGSLAFWRRATQAQTLWMLIQWIDLVTKKGWTLQKVMNTLVPAFGIA